MDFVVFFHSQNSKTGLNLTHFINNRLCNNIMELKYGLSKIYLNFVECFFSIFCRTQTECGGMCLSYSSCDAFYWDGSTCSALKKELLYADKTTQVDFFVSQPNGPGKL